MSNFAFEDLVVAIVAAWDEEHGDDADCAARVAIAYLASCAPVEAGPELTPSDARRLPWRVIHPAPDERVEGVGITWSYSEDAIAHRVNNWDALCAQLAATRARLDDALVRNMREQDEHSATRAALVRERDAARERAEDLERDAALALGDDL